MPYAKTSDLPDSVRDSLPVHAQDIYMSTFNDAWDEYPAAQDSLEDDSRDASAHKDAWAAVRRSYEKDSDGYWRRRR